MMSSELSSIKVGLAIVLLGVFFSVAMGISFGVNEDAYKNYVAEGVAAYPEVHDEKSQSKIWRYAQRAHFHAGGVSALCLGLVILVMFSDLRARLKQISAILIGLGIFYAFSWFSMFYLAPSIGRHAAHEHLLTKLFTAIGVGGLLLGSFLLLANIYLGLFRDTDER